VLPGVLEVPSHALDLFAGFRLGTLEPFVQFLYIHFNLPFFRNSSRQSAITSLMFSITSS
jgi:hypothetical protein